MFSAGPVPLAGVRNPKELLSCLLSSLAGQGRVLHSKGQNDVSSPKHGEVNHRSLIQQLISGVPTILHNHCDVLALFHPQRGFLA